VTKKTKILISLAAFFVFICAIVAIINGRILLGAKQFTYTTSTTPSADAILILGAKVYNDGKLSWMLQDRADTALELYANGVAKKFLVSGDHGQKNYDEVNTIKDYLLAKGIKPENIFLDHAGFSTYDSLYRAKAIFNIKTVVVATQKFHLPRAVYIGNKLGIKTYGVNADKHYYKNGYLNEIREWPARVKTWLMVLFRMKPKFLGEKIPITGDSLKSWDKINQTY